jgi:hypothetical protein
MVAIGAGTVLALGWLWVSFQAPGRKRSVVEWTSALAMYLLLLMLMAAQFHRFWDDGRWVMMTTFGFLVFLFGSGFIVTFVLLLRELVGKKSAGTDATH